MKKGFFSAKNVTGMAVLMALVVVLQAFGATITIGPVSLNFALIPIVLGAILYGPIVGALMGLSNGIVVFIQVVMGLVPFYTLIWTNTPVWAALTCLVKTTAAGWLAGFVFGIIEKKNRYVAVFTASAIVPIVNTGLFIVGCLLMKDAISTISGGQNLFVFILVSLVTFNFFLELAVNLLVAPAVHTVYRVIGKKTAK